MKIYVFGNEYVAEDERAIEVARELEGAIEGISFVFVNPNEDVPFVNERYVVILDTVQELQGVALIEGDGIDALILSPRVSVSRLASVVLAHNHVEARLKLNLTGVKEALVVGDSETR